LSGTCRRAIRAQCEAQGYGMVRWKRFIGTGRAKPRGRRRLVFRYGGDDGKISVFEQFPVFTGIKAP